MQVEDITQVAISDQICIMTTENILAFVQSEQARGVGYRTLRQYKGSAVSLYDWLPDDKTLTKERLLSWRQSLKNHGYSSETELNYVKSVNRYLDYIGRSDLRFTRGRAKDLFGKKFGYLEAIEPTGKKHRKDYIWRCRCKCGKEVEYPATQLLTGHTISCGCLRKERLNEANKYIAGTSLRQSMEEKVFSSRTESGYVGVTKKRGKWKAQITYKGKNYSLGCYTKLEDAVKARARGKELVQMDAKGLLDFYEELHKNDPALPKREEVRKVMEEPTKQPTSTEQLRAKRSNNTSGYPGVSQEDNKWIAKITYRKVTYWLGSFENKDQAIVVRQQAEQLLKEDPQKFIERYKK